MVECKKDSILSSEPEKQSETNTTETLTEGAVVYSEFLKDGQLVEQCIDSVVNFGSKENPAYFYVNLSHTVYDTPIENKLTERSTAFYSATLEDFDKFISMYAQRQNLCSGTSITDEQKETAYQHLYNFLQENNIDGSQLVAMTMKEESVLNATLECGNIIPVKNPDTIEVSIPFAPNFPGDIVPYVQNMESSNTSVMDSILEHIVLLRNGLKIPFSIKPVDENTENTGPDPYNTNTYVSYINESEDDSREYYDTKTFQSPVYTCRYGTKGCPMVESEFHIEGWYASKLKGEAQKVYYVPYLKTMINDIHVGTTMHLEGTVKYNEPDIRQLNADEYPIIGSGEVEINYGDSWAVKRVGRLKFSVDGITGFREDYWDSNE